MEAGWNWKIQVSSVSTQIAALLSTCSTHLLQYLDAILAPSSNCLRVKGILAPKVHFVFTATRPLVYDMLAAAEDKHLINATTHPSLYAKCLSETIFNNSSILEPANCVPHHPSSDNTWKLEPSPQWTLYSTRQVRQRRRQKSHFLSNAHVSLQDKSVRASKTHRIFVPTKPPR